MSVECRSILLCETLKLIHMNVFFTWIFHMDVFSSVCPQVMLGAMPLLIPDPPPVSIKTEQEKEPEDK